VFVAGGLVQGVSEVDHAEFCRAVSELTGFDVGWYREDVVERKVEFCGGREALVRALVEGRLSPEEAVSRLVVGFTRFFRDEECFRELERVWVPELFKMAGGGLRVWSAGCCAGAEAYSVAMVLEDVAPGAGHRVLATDVSVVSLEAGRRGEYEWDALRPLSVRRFARYFRQCGGRWAVSDGLRRVVEFRRHDLLRDPYPGGMHLVACRNVLVYLKAEASRRVLEGLAGALVPGGMLFVGKKDPVEGEAEAWFTCVSPCFWRKRV
jgi:chemotaxis protein methyltransferase CheR